MSSKLTYEDFLEQVENYKEKVYKETSNLKIEKISFEEYIRNCRWIFDDYNQLRFRVDFSKRRSE